MFPGMCHKTLVLRNTKKYYIERIAEFNDWEALVKIKNGFFYTELLRIQNLTMYRETFMICSILQNYQITGSSFYWPSLLKN
jgi:hypothetical protein